MTGSRLLLLVVVTALVGGGLYLSRAPGVRAQLFGGAGRATTTSDGLGAAFRGLERSPMSAAAWLHLGEEAQRQGATPLARAAFRAAQEIAPDDGAAHARLGFLLYEEGRDEAALEELRLAREKGADVAMLDFTLAMMRSHVDTRGPFPRFSDDDDPAEDDPAEDQPAEDDPAEDDPVAPRAPPPGERAAAAPDAEEADPPPAIDPPRPPAEDEPAGDEPLEEPDFEDQEPFDPSDDDEVASRDEPERAAPALVEAGAAGACELALERKSAQGIFVVDALVNGVAARLIVDTGASLTVLSRDFLRESGLSLDEDGVISARTAAGAQRFATASVHSVEIGERTASDIRVAICEECGMPGSDGLLGLDVQEPLGMSLFPSRGTVRFADCFE